VQSMKAARVTTRLIKNSTSVTIVSYIRITNINQLI
jgi:hypothetical protein